MPPASAATSREVIGGPWRTSGPGDDRPARVRPSSGVAAYWQIGSPSFVDPPPSEIAQVFVVDACDAEAVQPVAVLLLIVTVTPL